ncbi:MAG: GNAT family N-acetyltransferase [Burkholderiales bacterium]
MTTERSKGAVDTGIIRSCTGADFNAMLAIINDAATAYRGVIPEDCWHDPYMRADELSREIAADIRFAGYDHAGSLIGVMGTQPVQDVTLIRHAYVSTRGQRRGVGTALLQHLRARTDRPILIGTWAAAHWAIRFYEQHGFRVIESTDKNALLKKYWTVSDRQIETSVVLADERWPRR